MREKTQKSKSNPVIGISIGDLNGIGAEVVIKALSDQRILNQLTPVIFASGGLMSFYRKKLDLHKFNYHQISDLSELNPKRVNVHNTWTERVEIQPGTPSKEGGKYAKISLEYATNALKEGHVQALVTAPISKEMIQANGFEFPGHTEYLTAAFEKKDSVMLMVHNSLRIGVATGHIPLQDVSASLTTEVLERKIEILYGSLKKDFGIKKPKIAVLGLNPHAGEQGKLGKEEGEFIEPVVEKLKADGKLIMGPFPADGFFGSGQYRQYDAILAMYHDQGLIPFKYMAGGAGVNFTAGIPGIRTSPAHGTAFSIAGQGQSDHSSMLEALFLALDLVHERQLVD